MGDIYKSAVRTVVWLGATNEKYKNTVSICSELAATVTDGQRSSKQKGTSNGKASKVDNAKPSDGGDLNNDTSIESLVQLPWWSRVWVVQEVILARDVLLLLGRQSLDWNTFRAAVETGFAQGHWQQHALGNIRVRDFDYFLSLKAIQESVRSEGPADTFLDLLVQLRVRDASDPRDKIFSVLGILGNGVNMLNITPDYTSSPSTVFKTTAERLLFESRSLDILGVASTNQHETSTIPLPSWVPDWSVTKTIALPFRTGSSDSNHLRATAGSKSSPTVADSTLIISGHIFDTITELAEVLPDLNDEPWTLPEE